LNSFANRVLLAIVATLVAVDAAWSALGHFDVDAKSYGVVLLLAAALAGLGLFYARHRPDPNLAAMLFGASFLCVFSAGADLLNYLLLTVAGRPIDVALARIDSAMGFDWRGLMGWASAHPLVNRELHRIYETTLPQIAVLIVCLGLFGQPERIYGFCVALAAGAAIAIGFWTLFPSFGAFAVYHLPMNLAAKVNAALDGSYARQLQALLSHGPGHISPAAVKGLIGFPSFHTVMALLTVWYARGLPGLRWLALALNILVIVSTPVHGGHHLVDVFGGCLAAAAAVWISRRVLALAPEDRRTHLIDVAEPHAFPSV